MAQNNLSISLTDSEKVLFELIPKCEVKSVKSLIETKGSAININVADYRGITPMYLAIENDCVDIVRYFLTLNKLQINDSALHAISHGNVQIATLLLDKLKSIDPQFESVGTDSMDTFSANRTPMIVAAESGSYEMIEMLRKRGHQIYHPHKRSCSCSDCSRSDGTAEDGLSETDKRIVMYRALTNPAYILHTSTDPILTCFHLYDELLCWSKVDIGSNKRYLDIADTLNEFLTGLLDETRGSREVLEILNKRGEDEFGGSNFPRLVHAMRIKEKKFVGHPHVQAKSYIAINKGERNLDLLKDSHKIPQA